VNEIRVRAIINPDGGKCPNPECSATLSSPETPTEEMIAWPYRRNHIPSFCRYCRTDLGAVKATWVAVRGKQGWWPTDALELDEGIIE
jgi:hypothetical protein